MKHSEHNHSEYSGYFMIPVEKLNRIETLLQDIKGKIEEKFPDAQNALDYMDEKTAIGLLGRKATWFWSLRKEGKIKYTKVGSKVFYPRSEINRLLEEG